MSRRCSSRGSVDGHAEHLVVAAGLVGHPEHADRAALDQAAGERGLLEQHQGVERVAVQAEGVLDEAVVGGVLRRGEQRPVEADPAALVVHLVLVALTLRDLHQYVELHSTSFRQTRPVPFAGHDRASLAALSPEPHIEGSPLWPRGAAGLSGSSPRSSCSRCWRSRWSASSSTSASAGSAGDRPTRAPTRRPWRRPKGSSCRPPGSPRSSRRPASAVAVDPARVAATVRPFLRKAVLGRHYAVLVTDLSTGRPVFRQGAPTITPASTDQAAHLDRCPGEPRPDGEVPHVGHLVGRLPSARARRWGRPLPGQHAPSRPGRLPEPGRRRDPGRSARCAS